MLSPTPEPGYLGAKDGWLVDMASKRDILVQVARLGLVGRPQDVQAYLRRTMRTIRAEDPAVAEALSVLMATAPTASAPFRDMGGSSFVPVDGDSKQALIRHDHLALDDRDPVLTEAVRARLDQVVEERAHLSLLEKEGLAPTRSVLFTGPPGVGKTFSARWIARRLGRPLLTLDLATVMSSYLGKTGSNIRAVLDYAKSVPCVLLLDEFDAIAKRRDDSSDIGELRRLVTVILQEVDDWPSDNLMIAATNHGELLDPAIWRRFDEVVSFEIPDEKLVMESIAQMIDADDQEASAWTPILARLWQGRSFSDLARGISSCRRRAVITGAPLGQCIAEFVRDDLVKAPLPIRRDAALKLHDAGVTERRINQLTGVARDTLRKYRRQNHT